MGCEPEFDVQGFAEALKFNSKSRGNIMIYTSSQKSFRGTEEDILAKLTKAGVARKRLKNFFVKLNDYEAIELWFLPGQSDFRPLKKVAIQAIQAIMDE